MSGNGMRNEIKQKTYSALSTPALAAAVTADAVACCFCLFVRSTGAAPLDNDSEGEEEEGGGPPG